MKSWESRSKRNCILDSLSSGWGHSVHFATFAPDVAFPLNAVFGFCDFGAQCQWLTVYRGPVRYILAQNGAMAGNRWRYNPTYTPTKQSF